MNSPRARRIEELAAAGLTGERAVPGLYVWVVECGARPHGADARESRLNGSKSFEPDPFRNWSCGIALACGFKSGAAA